METPGVELGAVALYVEFEGESADYVVDEPGIHGQPDGVYGGGAHRGQQDEISVGSVGWVSCIVSGQIWELGKVFRVYEVVIQSDEKFHARNHGFELEFNLNFIDRIHIGVA